MYQEYHDKNLIDKGNYFRLNKRCKFIKKKKTYLLNNSLIIL